MTIIADLSEPCQISQTHMLHRCNLIAIVGTGPGAKFFNDKGKIFTVLYMRSLLTALYCIHVNSKVQNLNDWIFHCCESNINKPWCLMAEKMQPLQLIKQSLCVIERCSIGKSLLTLLFIFCLYLLVGNFG